MLQTAPRPLLGTATRTPGVIQRLRLQYTRCEFKRRPIMSGNIRNVCVSLWITTKSLHFRTDWYRHTDPSKYRNEKKWQHRNMETSTYRSIERWTHVGYMVTRLWGLASSVIQPTTDVADYTFIMFIRYYEWSWYILIVYFCVVCTSRGECLGDLLFEIWKNQRARKRVFRWL